MNSREPEIFCHIEGTYLIGRVDLVQTDRWFLISIEVFNSALPYEVSRAADSAGLESTMLRFWISDLGRLLYRPQPSATYRWFVLTWWYLVSCCHVMPEELQRRSAVCAGGSCCWPRSVGQGGLAICYIMLHLYHLYLSENLINILIIYIYTILYVYLELSRHLYIYSIQHISRPLRSFQIYIQHISGCPAVFFEFDR